MAVPTVIRDFFVLASGTGFGQLLILAVTPLLTRLLLPAELGLFGTFSTFVAMLSITCSLGFETAIIGAREDDALTVVGIACVSAIGLISVFTIGLWLLINFEVLQGLPLWFPPLILLDTVLANCFVAAQYWYIRNRQFKQASIGALSLNGGRGLASVAGAVALPGPLALPAGDIIGRAAGLLAVDREAVTLRAIGGLLRAPAKAWQVGRRYWKSAFFQMPSATLEVGLFWLPVLLSSAVYGIEFAGHVALVQRILSAPLALVGRSVSDIYQVWITGRDSAIPGRVMKSTLALIGGMLALAAPACVVLWLWGPQMFVFIFGSNWAVAGGIVAILTPLIVFQLCGNIITRLLIEIGRQELRLIAFVTLLVSMLSTFYAGHSLHWQPVSTLTVMSVSGCTIFAIWIVASLAVFWNSAKTA